MEADSLPAAENKQPKLRWYQFSLRTLLIVVTLFAFACSWFAVKMQQAKKQRAEIERIDRLGGNVYYGYQCDETGKPIHDVTVIYNGTVQEVRYPESSVPQCLRNVLGDDFFHTPAAIELFDLDALDELKKLDVCKRLKFISFTASISETSEDEEITKRLEQSFPQSKIETGRIMEQCRVRW